MHITCPNDNKSTAAWRPTAHGSLARGACEEPLLIVAAETEDMDAGSNKASHTRSGSRGSPSPRFLLNRCSVAKNTALAMHRQTYLLTRSVCARECAVPYKQVCLLRSLSRSLGSTWAWSLASEGLPPADPTPLARFPCPQKSYSLAW